MFLNLNESELPAVLDDTSIQVTLFLSRADTYVLYHEKDVMVQTGDSLYRCTLDLIAAIAHSGVDQVKVELELGITEFYGLLKKHP